MNKDITAPLYQKAGLQSPPIWFMRQAGRYLPEYREIRAQCSGFLDLCFNETRAASVTMQPLQRFTLDAAIVFSDILIIPMALGRKLWFVEGEGPRLEPLSLTDWNMHRKDFAKTIGPTCRAIAKVKSQIDDDQSMIGFCGAPFTLACYMIDGKGGDFARTRDWCKNHRDALVQLLGLLEIAIGDCLLEQIEHGADCVKIFDSWAGIVAQADYDDFIIAPVARIVARIKHKYPHICAIGFPRGIVHDQLGVYAKACQIDVLALGHDVSPVWAAKNLAGKICLQGNLSPELLIQGGQDLDDAIDIIMKNLAGSPFIFNLGHGIDKQTPIVHVQQMIARVKSYQ